jgi:hypothetical protein
MEESYFASAHQSNNARNMGAFEIEHQITDR